MSARIALVMLMSVDCTNWMNSSCEMVSPSFLPGKILTLLLSPMGSLSAPRIISSSLTSMLPLWFWSMSWKRDSRAFLSSLRVAHLPVTSISLFSRSALAECILNLASEPSLLMLSGGLNAIMSGSMRLQARAIFLAVSRLSPVSIQTLMPPSRRSSMHSGTRCCSWSSMAVAPSSFRSASSSSFLNAALFFSFTCLLVILPSGCRFLVAKNASLLFFHQLKSFFDSATSRVRSPKLLASKSLDFMLNLS
mmetsp:Transcript_21695/g.38512  ORF Transcript_21695/g.38512 Transcript_21695/m.38512 type:complete len:250 (-) Transcript_21695:1950-2699(-)